MTNEERRDAGVASDFNAIDYLNNEGWQRVELGLERIRELLRRLGDPQRGRAYVHVAGTNGKGSVCAFIESVLRRAGFAPGLFTSPAIYSFEERICFDGAPINADELLAATRAVKVAADAMVAEGWEHPTGFELMFAVAAVFFRTVGCQIAVLEVGLGGRLDATNAIDEPELCVITPIGLDHTDVLGDKLETIAGEKAAIIKAGADVVTGFQTPEALAVIRAAAEQCGVGLFEVDEASLTVASLDLARGRRRFSYDGDEFETRLLGAYQPSNAALAIEACRALARRGWALSEVVIAEGIAAARWPGRFEIVGASPLVIVDGAHNPDGAASLAASLEDLLGSLSAEGQAPPLALVIGVLADKDARGILGELVGFADELLTFPPPSYRAMPAEELAALAREVAAVDAAGAAVSEEHGVAARAADDASSVQKESPKATTSGLAIRACANAEKALDRAFQAVGADGIIVCAGSLYSLGEIRDALRLRARADEAKER